MPTWWRKCIVLRGLLLLPSPNYEMEVFCSFYYSAIFWYPSWRIMERLPGRTEYVWRLLEEVLGQLPWYHLVLMQCLYDTLFILLLVVMQWLPCTGEDVLVGECWCLPGEDAGMGEDAYWWNAEEVLHSFCDGVSLLFWTFLTYTCTVCHYLVMLFGSAGDDGWNTIPSGGAVRWCNYHYRLVDGVRWWPVVMVYHLFLRLLLEHRWRWSCLLLEAVRCPSCLERLVRYWVMGEVIFWLKWRRGMIGTIAVPILHYGSDAWRLFLFCALLLIILIPCLVLHMQECTCIDDVSDSVHYWWYTWGPYLWWLFFYALYEKVIWREFCYSEVYMIERGY